MRNQSRGFTLIELVVVITILGILAAFALPRFAGLETDARKAAVHGLLGSVRAASALAHSIALVQGKTVASSAITMDGVTINLANLYPTDADIDNAIQDTSGFTLSAAGVFEKDGATTPASCKVTYVNGTPPTISETTSGC